MILGLNQVGANIPYPYDVPLVTGNGKFGFWTLYGYLETVEARMPDPSGKSHRKYKLNCGKGE